MQVIWKAQLQCTDKQTIDLPKGAEVLCVQTQNELPCIWFLVSDVDSIHKEPRTFYIYGTGHKHEAIGDGLYIGTFQLQGGKLVFHVFEE